MSPRIAVPFMFRSASIGIIASAGERNRRSGRCWPAIPTWFLAFSRFGLGARPGAQMRSGDPREALLRELATPSGARLDDAALSGTPQILQAVFADELRRKKERERADAARIAALAMPAPNVAALIFPNLMDAPAMAPNAAAPAGPATPMMTPEPPPEQKFFRADAQARLEQACAAPIGFVERLVAFWSNHFCVSVAKSAIGRAAAGAFEREAIRPYVLGRFADMLRGGRAAPRDAELPRQRAIDRSQLDGRPQIARRGLNENLGARDPRTAHDGRRLGLHPDRRDPARLYPHRLDDRRPRRQARRARAPSSSTPTPTSRWPRRCAAASICRRASRRARRRSPTSRARPATATHIARKFARHFVADTPDPAPRRSASPRSFATPTAISARWRARSSMTRPPGARRRRRCAIPGS